MSTQELLTFQRFKDPDIANDIAEKLKDAGIAYEIEDDRKAFDLSFAENPMRNEVRIKLSPADFSMANKVLNDYYAALVGSVDRDYYLFEFTNDELMDIIIKPDEWGRLDYQLAQKILKERGREVNSKDLEYLKEKRIDELAKPEKPQNTLIFAGYVSAFLGGLFGIVIGWILAYSKRTLPDGQSVYAYTDRDRAHGRLISTIGLSLMIAVLFSSLYYRYVRS